MISLKKNHQRPSEQRMRSTRRLGIFLGALLAVFSNGGEAEDWYQFRGPSGDGHITEKNVPTTWGGFFEKPVWKTVVPGRGWSSPIVAANRIWLTSSEQLALSDQAVEQKLASRPFGSTDFQTHASVVLFAVELNADTGEILRRIDLFSVENPPPIHSMNSYASPTPVTDGLRVYCHFGSLGTACIDIPSGKVLWRREFKIEEITGGGASPVLWDNHLFVPFDGSDEQYLVALDKLTGQTKWKSARPPIEASNDSHRRAFSTPLLVDFDGRVQLISAAAQWLVSYNPEDGSEWWRAKVGDGHALVPRPVFQNGSIFVCTGYSKPQMVAIQVNGSGDVTESAILWRSSRQVPEIASPIIVGREIYFVSAMGVATCLDTETGALVWQHRMGGTHASSPSYSDGRIYFTSQEGITTVIRPGLVYSEIAKNELFGETLASLAVYQGMFLLRTDPNLYCLKRVPLE
jgi:outer membrane protein assembly factor BamB